MDLRKSSKNQDINPGVINRPRTRGLSFGKVIYFTVLIGIFLFLLFYVFSRLYYVRSTGVLTASTTQIASIKYARVANIPVVRGQHVGMGDTLVVLWDRDNYGGYGDNNKQRTTVRTDSNAKQRYLDLKKELQLLKIEEENQKATQDELAQDYEKAKQLLLSDAINNRDFQRIKKSYEDIQYDLQLTREKVYYTSLKLQNNSGQTVTTTYYDDDKDNTYGGSIGALLSQTVLTAPHNGLVTSVHKRNYEAVAMVDPILNLVDTDNHFVTTYFDFSDKDYVNVGVKVRVLLNDGYRYRGYIRDIYPEGQNLLEEFRKEFSLREKYIVTEVFVVPPTPLIETQLQFAADSLVSTTKTVFKDLVNAGYIDQEGYLSYYFRTDTDRWLKRLDDRYDKVRGQLSNLLLRINNSLNFHTIGTSCTVLFPFMGADDIWPKAYKE